jgi:hypothetical protein
LSPPANSDRPTATRASTPMPAPIGTSSGGIFGRFLPGSGRFTGDNPAPPPVGGPPGAPVEPPAPEPEVPAGARDGGPPGSASGVLAGPESGVRSQGLSGSLEPFPFTRS